jgi:hypothetical protein
MAKIIQQAFDLTERAYLYGHRIAIDIANQLILALIYAVLIELHLT